MPKPLELLWRQLPAFGLSRPLEFRATLRRATCSLQTKATWLSKILENDPCGPSIGKADKEGGAKSTFPTYARRAAPSNVYGKGKT